MKGVEIGDGFDVVSKRGSENNDEFYSVEEEGKKKILKKTNHAGGILGGISDGSDIILRAAFKPTPSIYRLQHTVNKDGENKEEEPYNPVPDASKTMMWMMPIMSISIAAIAPLGLALYWLMNNILMIIERLVFNKISKKEEEAEVDA